MIDKSKIRILKDDKMKSDKIKILSDTMFNGAVYTINFVWLYMLELYNDGVLYIFDQEYKIEDIAKLIDRMKEDLRNLQSINQVYVYLYNAREKFGGVVIPPEKLAERIPSYAKSINIDKINEYLKEGNKDGN